MRRGLRIIIEGPDLSGKSTLARNTNYRYCNEVQDRSFISAFVYDQALRGGEEISEEEFESWCCKFLDNNETFVAILVPCDALLEMRHKQRGDDSFSLEQIKKVRNEYRRVYQKFLRERMNVLETILDEWYAADHPDRDFDSTSACDEYIGVLVEAGIKSLSAEIRADISSLEVLTSYKPVLGYDFRYRFDNNDHLAKITSEFQDNNNCRGNLEHNDYYAIHGQIADKLHYANETFKNRRLIAHTDMCISLFHVQLENEKVVVNWVLRSSNVRDSLVLDMAFMLGETLWVLDEIEDTKLKTGYGYAKFAFPIELNIRILNAHSTGSR